MSYGLRTGKNERKEINEEQMICGVATPGDEIFLLTLTRLYIDSLTLKTPPSPVSFPLVIVPSHRCRGFPSGIDSMARAQVRHRHAQHPTVMSGPSHAHAHKPHFCRPLAPAS